MKRHAGTATAAAVGILVAGVVAGCTAEVHRAAATAGREWHGDASTAFRAKAATGAGNAEVLAADLDRVARELDRYAGELREAQRTMAAARRIAAEGRLALTDTRIFDPAGGEQVEAYRRAEAERAAAVGRRVLGKVPLIGWGVTAAGIGYDIHNGKPAGKAVLSGLGGAAAALAVGAAVGGPIGVGVVVGIGVGVLVGVGLDHAYDALPAGVREGIDNGIDAVGDAIGGGAKKVWDSVFG